MAMSKPSTLKDEVDDELTCSVCLEMFNVDQKTPKMLGCGHTFCKPCLVQCAQERVDGKLHCPLCKAVHDVRPRGINGRVRPQGIDGLRNNLVIMSLLNRMEKLKAEKGNKIICASHSLDCEEFCETCQQGICAKCYKDIAMKKTMETHADHEILNIEDAIVQAKRSVEAQMKKVDDELKKIPLENDRRINEFNKQFESLRKDNEIAWQKAQKRLNEWKHRNQSTLDKIQKEHGSSGRSNLHKEHKNLNAESLKITSRLKKGEFSGVKSSKDFAETASVFVEKIQREEKREFPEVRMDVFNMSDDNINIGKILVNDEEDTIRLTSNYSNKSSLSPRSYGYRGKYGWVIKHRENRFNRDSDDFFFD